MCACKKSVFACTNVDRYYLVYIYKLVYLYKSFYSIHLDLHSNFAVSISFYAKTHIYANLKFISWSFHYIGKNSVAINHAYLQSRIMSRISVYKS